MIFKSGSDADRQKPADSMETMSVRRQLVGLIIAMLIVLLAIVISSP